MLTLKTLREDPELVIKKLAKKHFDDFVEEFIDPDYRSHIIEAHWEDMKPMSDRFRDKFFFYTK